MKIHKEGIPTIVITLFLIIIIRSLFSFDSSLYGGLIFAILSLLFFLFILSFFRDPNRPVQDLGDLEINCPADGKVVVIEETPEDEYFKEKKLLVSIFMSPLNVHINRHPIDAKIAYYKYHPGKYLAAWNPKASTLNERTTVVYDTGGQQFLLRQVAGALARRIVCYVNEGDEVKRGSELGFIKFGSRVDLYLPIGTDVKVKIGQMVKGNIDVIAELKN